MTIEKMRQELINFYETAGQSQIVDEIKKMSADEVEKNFAKIIEEDAYDKARIRLDEDTVQKEFDKWKGRGKI